MKKMFSLFCFLLLIASVSASGIYVQTYADGSYQFKDLPMSYREMTLLLPEIILSPYWYDLWASEDPITWMEMPVTVSEKGYVSVYPTDGFVFAKKVSKRHHDSIARAIAKNKIRNFVQPSGVQ